MSSPVINYVTNWPAAACPKCQQAAWSVQHIPGGSTTQTPGVSYDVLGAKCGVCGYTLYMKTYS